MKLIDKLVGYLSPVAGLKRLAARAHLAAAESAMQQLAAYDSAKKNRMDSDWQANARSADGALIDDLGTIRDRSRQAIRDDDAARSGQKAFVRHVVGTGITCVSDATDPETNESMEAFNTRADALWNAWWKNRKLVDVERKKTGLQKQRLWMKEIYAAGEILLVMTYNRRGRGQSPLAIQEIESEQFDTDITECDGRKVVGGVEVDDCGAPLAYHVFQNSHPLDNGYRRHTARSVRLPAERCIHLFDAERVRQTRGEPMMACGLRRARNLAMYDSYMMCKARIEAAFGAIVTDEPGVGNLGTGSLPANVAAQLGVPANNGGGNTADSIFVNLEPGLIPSLGNKKVWFPPPASPNSQYEPFSQVQLKRFFAGIGLDYPTGTRDFAAASFSAQLQGLLEIWRETDPFQLQFIDAMQDIRSEFLALAVMTGQLDAPRFFADPIWQDAYCRANWAGPEKTWINPADQVAATVMQIKHGLKSRTRVLNEHGGNFKQVMNELKAEDDLAKKLSLHFETLNPLPENPSAPPVDPREPRPDKARPVEQQPGGNGNGNGKGYALAGPSSPGGYAGARRLAQ